MKWRKNHLEKPPLRIVNETDFKGPAPARKLGPHGAALWRSVTDEYNIEDCGGTEILTLACQALDRAEELAKQIDKDGPTVLIKSVLREHPLLKAELANRAFVARNLQRLGLNLEVIKPVGRPPGRY